MKILQDFIEFSEIFKNFKELAMKSPQAQINVTESCMRFTGDKDYTYTVMVGNDMDVMATRR